MGYLPIADSEVDAESPITESLMTRLRDNALAFAQLSFTVLNGSGTYTVPDGITKLRVVAVSGGGGGASRDSANTYLVDGGGGGGGGGMVRDFVYIPDAGEISGGVIYSCGAGGSGGGAGSLSKGSNGGSTTFGTYTVGGGAGAVACFGGNTSHAAFARTSAILASATLLYAGGIGGNGNTGAGKYGTSGSTNLSTHGIQGAGGISVGAYSGGGGGAAGSINFSFEDAPLYLGTGGDGATSPATSGSNGGLYGAGGGGGNLNGSGGNGSAGIIFVLPIG